MLRKIFLSLILILVIGSAAYLYCWYRMQKTPVGNAPDAIPSSASFIIETRQAGNMWKKISETNILWADLLSTQFFTELNKSGHFIDSLLTSAPEVYSMMEDRPVFISAHLSGADSFDFLYTFSLPAPSKEPEIRNLILRSTLQNQGLPSRQYDGGEISMVKFISSDRIFYYAIHKGIFSGSFSRALVEDAIRQLNSGNGISSDKNFLKALKIAGEKADADVYINYRQFPGILRTFLKTSAGSSMDFLSGFAEWSEADLLIKPNALLMNGYTFADTGNYLNLFLHQKPQQVELTRIIPSNTSTLLFLGTGDFKVFHRDYVSWLGRHGKLPAYMQPVSAINSKYGVDIEHRLLSWVDNEMGMVITEPAQKDFSGNSFAVLRSNSAVNAVKMLNGLCDTINKTEKEKDDTISFSGFTVRKFPLPGILAVLLGDAFSNVKANYFSAVEDYIVFGSSKEAMHTFINSYGSGKTLAKSNYYLEFAQNNLADEASLYLYSNIARSTEVYKNYVKENYETDIDHYLDLFRKFEAVGIQLSPDRNMFYQNIYLRHNPIYKKESSSLWETALDTTVHQAPQLVLNHNNQTREIFVQDDANTVYLISNTGKILWKRKLDEKIMSDVFQVDAKKNKKLQLLFNTASRIYLIDRNGKDVDNFPLELKSKASSGLAVFDYEDSRDYRILVPCSDKTICNYTAEGKEAPKWKPEKTEDEVNMPVQYFNIASKDYLAVIDAAGSVYIMNRRGEKILKPKARMPAALKTFFVEAGKDLSSSCFIAADSAGRIKRQKPGQDAEPVKLPRMIPPCFFNYRDIDNDGIKEYIFTHADTLSVYNQDGSLKWHYRLQHPAKHAAQLFVFTGNKIKTGITDEASNEVWLIDENGNAFPGSPFFGSAGCSVGTINKDEHYNLITASGKFIYVYTIR